MLEQPLLFTGWSSIQFFNYSLSQTQSIRTPQDTLSLTVHYLCDLQDAMSLHWSRIASHLALT